MTNNIIRQNLFSPKPCYTMQLPVNLQVLELENIGKIVQLIILLLFFSFWEIVSCTSEIL